MYQAFIDATNIGKLFASRNIDVYVNFDLKSSSDEYSFSPRRRTLVLRTRYPRYRTILEILLTIYIHDKSTCENIYSILDMMHSVFPQIHSHFADLKAEF